MPSPAEDPVLTSARREAIVVFAAWACALVYTVTYCYLNGYNRSLDDLKFVYGFPDWIFWGIVTPWAACIAFSFLFGALFMKDEDLGKDPDGESGVEFHLDHLGEAERV
jgi:hypothetical protein